MGSSAEKGLAHLREDPDITAERHALENNATRTTLVDHILNWRPGTGGHKPSDVTQRLLLEAGGPDAIRRFTEGFYQKAFLDPHLDQFIREHDDPHGERFADWIVEKFSGNNVWTNKRQSRSTCPFSSHAHTFQTPHDRSTAHYAAWHSPKRMPGTFGRHFKLDDCRVWMRLHFWALRESGLVTRSPSFCAYYVKFIGHFISIYEVSRKWYKHREPVFFFSAPLTLANKYPG